MKIGNKTIGKGEPVFIVAEIGINHNGSLDLAKKLIDASVDAGADCVKFQKRNLEDIYQKELLDNPNLGEQAFQYALPILKESELTDEDYREIVEYCRQKGIIFSCSPWDKKSVDFLETLDIPFYKIASPELTNVELIKYVASKGKPIILSTGIYQLEEIRITVDILKNMNAEFILLHCNSTYPAPSTEINLKFMETLKKEFNIPVGYSGHERGTVISVAASAMGACVIERHITLDKSMAGPDHKASLELDEFRKMIQDIRLVEEAQGSGKKHFTRGEIFTKDLLGKSLLAGKDIKKGDILKREDIVVKSPGKGLSPQRIDELIGKVAGRDVKKEDYFVEDDIFKKEISIPKNDDKKWGLKVRYDDIDSLMVYKPKLVEFHFTDKDLELDIPDKKYDTELAVHAPEYYKDHILDYCSVDEEKRKIAIQVLQKTIDKTNELKRYYNTEKPFIVFHVGGMSLEPIKGKDSRLMENLIDSLSRIDARGVELLPENQVPFPWFFGGQWYLDTFISAEEIKQFCEKYNYNMCFDIAHAQLACNACKGDLIDFIKTIRPFVREFHLADAYGVNGEGVQIGDGDINWQEVLEYFKGYQYGFVPEIWRGHLENGRAFVIAMNKLISYLK